MTLKIAWDLDDDIDDPSLFSFNGAETNLSVHSLQNALMVGR
jgi:hypothetical protein